MRACTDEFWRKKNLLRQWSYRCWASRGEILFGTLGVAWDMLADIGGLVGDAYHETAFITAMFLWMIDMAAGLAICWIYGRWQGIKKGFAFVAVITIIQGGGEVLFLRWTRP